MMKNEIYDLAGIGIGPSNLGLAALCEPIKKLKTIFFDKNCGFNWHTGAMFKNSVLQMHYLKDLATPIDPTNHYTFLAYLASQNRLLQFINRKTDVVSRKEFELYYQWVCSRLDNLLFAKSVSKVWLSNGYFKIRANNTIYTSKHISCGIGQQPSTPSIFEQFTGSKVFHSIDFHHKCKNLELKRKKIVIIGGGQSGAEVFDHLISSPNYSQPAKIYWVSSRINFHPVEDACFNREIYTPFYNLYFQSLPQLSKEIFLRDLQLSGNGIDPNLIDNIYRKLYDLHLYSANLETELLPAHYATSCSPENQYYVIEVKNNLTGKNTFIKADIIICATGFKFVIPAFLKDLISPDEIGNLKGDYSITLSNNSKNKIYIQNGAQKTHGIADPYLSTSAWRNAVIINSLLGENYYNTTPNKPLFAWKNQQLSQQISQY